MTHSHEGVSRLSQKSPQQARAVAAGRYHPAVSYAPPYPSPSPIPADLPLLQCGPGSGLSPQRYGFDAVRYRLIGIDPRRAGPTPNPTATATPSSPCRCA